MVAFTTENRDLNATNVIERQQRELIDRLLKIRISLAGIAHAPTGF